MSERVDERGAVLEMLRRHGAEVISFQVLERGFSYRIDAESDCCIAYVDTGAARVVAGSPVGPRDSWEPALARFMAETEHAGRRVCFFAVEGQFLSLPSVAAMRIGEQPWWVPSSWDETLRRSRSLREQIRRARAKGVRVRAVEPDELRPGTALRAEIERVMREWLARRKMPPMGFLTDLQPFDFPEERRYFVAERSSTIVGFLAAIPVFAQNAWFCEDFLRTPRAPNGTNELLFDAAIRRADADGAAGVTLGLAALSGQVGVVFRLVRAMTRCLYDFRGIRRFKARLSPARWEPVYLAWPRGNSAVFAVADSLTAFTFRGGPTPREQPGMLRFAWRTLIRSRPLVRVVVLALLLGLVLIVAAWSHWSSHGADHARAPTPGEALRVHWRHPTRRRFWISTTPSIRSAMASARSFIQRAGTVPLSVTSPANTLTSSSWESSVGSAAMASQTSS